MHQKFPIICSFSIWKWHKHLFFPVLKSKSIITYDTHIEKKKTLLFRRLDQMYGYPPNAVVERFQQRLKAIKGLDRYSDFIQAIHMSEEIKSPEAMIEFFRKSIHVSNKQGYTNILSDAEKQDRAYDQCARNQRQQYSSSRGYTRR